MSGLLAATLAVLILAAYIHFDTRDLDTHGFYIIGRTQRRKQSWVQKDAK